MVARSLIALLMLLAGLPGTLGAGEDGTWLTDFPKAQKQARAEGKMVLLDFTGSDWCSACKELKLEIFPKPEFVEFARQRLILVEVDFPQRKKQSEAVKAANRELKEKFKVTGYPTLILLDSEGRKLGEPGFDQDAASLVKEIQTLAAKAATP